MLNPAGTRAYITNYGNSGTDANISHGTSNGASYSNLINDSETSLPITVSTLHITHNGHPLNNDAVINIIKGSQGKFILSSTAAIPQFHLTIDPAIASYFQGSCQEATSLKAGQSCSLDYCVRDLSKNTTGYIVASAGEGPIVLSGLRINLKLSGNIEHQHSETHSVQPYKHYR